MIRTRADLLALSAWSHLEVDSSGNPCVWHNHYTCDCEGWRRSEWSDVWSCQCGDECLECGCAVEPYGSVWIGPESKLARAFWEALPEAGG